MMSSGNFEQRLKLLVVDDEPRILDSLEDLFADDFAVLKANNGPTALRLLKTDREHVAVILCDQRMPEMPGHRFLEKARRISAAYRVLITGYADLDAVVGAVNLAQIHSYVAKPWSPTELRRIALRGADQFRLEKALRESEERFRTVFDAAPNAMLMIHRNRSIMMINRRTEELFGYERSELVGQPVDILVPERYRAKHADFVERFFAEPTAEAMKAGRELVAQSKNGSEVQVEIGINPLETTEGRLVLASVADITERKQTEDELRRSNAELEQFAYVASHDLQEPIRMVKNYTDLLAKRYREKLDAKADKYLHYISDGARRMQRLVQDLLLFSRVGSQGKPLAPVETDSVVETVLASMESAIRDAGASIEYESLPLVLADEMQVYQLFQNLIGNAIKFRSEAAPKVVIEAAKEGDRWLFSVKDNGIGIEMQYAERSFQMFQRLQERDKYEGSGIGLSIAKRIVERHGGRIWIDSVLGAGTTIHFTFRAVPRNVAVSTFMHTGGEAK